MIEENITLEQPIGKSEQLVYSLTEVVILLQLIEKMSLPFSMNIDSSVCDPGQYKVFGYIQHKDKLLFDWVQSEVQRIKDEYCLRPV